MLLLNCNVVVSPEQAEDKEFVAWLNENGHKASIGDHDGNYVNGRCTLVSKDAYAEFQELFARYWRSEVK